MSLPLLQIHIVCLHLQTQTLRTQIILDVCLCLEQTVECKCKMISAAWTEIRLWLWGKETLSLALHSKHHKLHSAAQ